MLKNLNLKKKLTIYFISVGLLPMLIVTYIAVNSSVNSINNQAFNQLSAVQHIKANQLKKYFEDAFHDVEGAAESGDVLSAVEDLIKYHGEMHTGANESYKFSDNEAGLTKTYSEISKKIDTFLSKYVDVFGYYDIFLICSKHGHVMYTDAKESDLGTNLSTGELKNSGLAQVWEKTVSTNKPVLVDMSWYGPSNEPAMFIAAPIHNNNGEIISVAALEIPTKQIDQIMQERTGMGKTGETYLVGADFKMRSNSFLDPEGHSMKASFSGSVEKNGVSTKATKEVFQGREGEEVIVDYNGKNVLSVYSPIEITDGLTWAIIAEIDESEAFAAADNMRNLALMIMAGMAVFIGFVGYMIAKGISNPVRKISNAAKEISLGDVNVEVNHQSGDEIGELASSFNQLIDSQKIKVEAAKKIAAGHFEKVELASDKDDLSIAFNKEVDVIYELIHELETQIEDSKNGDLSRRAEAAKFQGKWKELVEGINSILDAVIKPIEDGSNVLAVMASGDLTARVTNEYKGDHRKITDSINQLGDSLENVLTQINEAVAATASAATQISSSSEEMAAGAQEQSAQSNEIAVAVEEMAKTILETTNYATNAAENSEKAGKVAKEGGDVMLQTISGMNKIADVVSEAAGTVEALGANSDKIGEIVQVIDDIADQTNLLALNAAIEAARAGEQGRGFAVVADEVRKLAERTTKATKEIADMIKTIQTDTHEAVNSINRGNSEVLSGKELAAKAGKSLEEIISSSNNVLSSITQVAAASEEQSTSAEQISKNIESINAVTQQSAAGVQQIARAAEDLNSLTHNLENLVSQFKIRQYNHGGNRKYSSSAVNANAEFVNY